jgi:hypothetical protein
MSRLTLRNRVHTLDCIDSGDSVRCQQEEEDIGGEIRHSARPD